jgi:hypothetical protein
MTKPVLLPWAVCIAYGLGALVWLADYVIRLRRGAPREETRRALAGGIAVFLAFAGATHTMLFWSLF